MCTVELDIRPRGMNVKWRHSTRLPARCSAFFSSGPKTGWDLVREVNSSVGYFWNVTRSQVYRELRMPDRGWTDQEQAPGKRDRVLYTITAAGKEAFREWIAERSRPRPPATAHRSAGLLR